MGVTNANKVISTNQIDCSGSLRVTLALTAAPDIIANPTDIVLVLDRSGSMTGAPLAAMKTGADTFIDIIAQATGGVGEIGSGSRIGIVSFAGTATADTQLITSVDTLRDAVDALTAGGNTNHADAFAQATALFDPQSSNAKVIVMFTDGNTTAGAPPAPVAAAARAQGIIIYAIGLVGSDGVDVSALNDWATVPCRGHAGRRRPRSPVRPARRKHLQAGRDQYRHRRGAEPGFRHHEPPAARQGHGDHAGRADPALDHPRAGHVRE